MPNPSTTMAPNETSLSAVEDTYEEHATYPPKEPRETSRGWERSDDEYLGVQRSAKQGGEFVSVTVSAGTRERTIRIMRANRRLAMVQSESR